MRELRISISFPGLGIHRGLACAVGGCLARSGYYYRCDARLSRRTSADGLIVLYWITDEGQGTSVDVPVVMHELVAAPHDSVGALGMGWILS